MTFVSPAKQILKEIEPQIYPYKHPQALSAFNDLIIKIKLASKGIAKMPSLEDINTVEELVYPILSELDKKEVKH